MSSANRERRRQNREVRMAAVEEALRRSRRQRITVAVVGLALALGVGVVLVARARGNGSNAASRSTTTTAPAQTTTTAIPSVAGKPCVAVSSPLPTGTPAVPLKIGPPPKRLVKEDLRVGTGAAVKPNATVTINYVGVACSTGKIFGSSFGQGTPFTTRLSDVIKGWTHGIPGMRVGGERLLGIPPELAYGSKNFPAGTSPDETLWFVVQLLKTK